MVQKIALSLEKLSGSESVQGSLQILIDKLQRDNNRPRMERMRKNSHRVGDGLVRIQGLNARTIVRKQYVKRRLLCR